METPRFEPGPPGAKLECYRCAMATPQGAVRCFIIMITTYGLNGIVKYGRNLFITTTVVAVRAVPRKRAILKLEMSLHPDKRHGGIIEIASPLFGT